MGSDSDWSDAKLSDVVDFLAGFAFRSEHYSEEPVGPRLCLGANVAPGEADWSKLRYWPAVKCTGLERYLLKADDVVLAMDRPWIPGGLKTFRVTAEDAPTLLVQRVARLRGTSRLDSGYLYGIVRHPAFTQYVLGVQTGSTVPHISAQQIVGYEFRLPPIDEQRRIAAVLGALDDKIELNRKLNRTLEAMAQALFKSWFIDFDGVPDSDLVESELGPIPKGWSWIPFEKAGQWVSGGTPNKKREDYWGGDIPWFSAKSLGPVWLQESEDRVTALGAVNGTRLVPRRSVIFLVRGMSLASEFRIGITAREATLNQDLKAILDNGSVLPELLLLWLFANREAIRQQADEAGHGTKRLPTTVLHAWSMAMPKRAEQERMAAPLCALLNRIEANQSETKTLTTLRDTLLPKLISGEVRVPEAETAVEAVL